MGKGWYEIMLWLNWRNQSTRRRRCGSKMLKTVMKPGGRTQCEMNNGEDARLWIRFCLERYTEIENSSGWIMTSVITSSPSLLAFKKKKKSLLPEKGVHDQGIPSNPNCSNHQNKEGNDVVSVVLDVHLSIESVIHIHFCDGKQKHRCGISESLLQYSMSKWFHANPIFLSVPLTY